MEFGYGTQVVTADSESHFEAKVGHMTTETEKVEFVSTSTSFGDEIERVDKGYEFSCETVDLSCEYVKDSVVTDISYEKVKDTRDSAGIFETHMIEVGTETFGEKHIVFVDTVTVHELTSMTEHTCTEFMSEMIDSESSMERTYSEQGCSHEVVVNMETIGSEFSSKVVDCSSEYTIKVIESMVDEMTSTSEIGVDILGLKVIDESSAYELSYLTVECETQEIVEEIVPQTDIQEESEMPRLENECISSEMTMIDIGTTVKATLMDVSVEMDISYVEQSSEWSKELIFESKVLETEHTICLSTMVSSDDDKIEYCSIDVEFVERKPNTMEFGYGTQVVTADSESHFEIFSTIFESISSDDLLVSDIGIQVTFVPKSSDFSQLFDFSLNDVLMSESKSTLSSDNESNLSEESFFDDFEWAEFGQDLHLLPVTISTQTDDFEELVMKFIQENYDSETVLSIRDILFDVRDSVDASCETSLDLSLIDFCSSSFGLDQIHFRLKGLRYYVDEFQNTDHLNTRSVSVQTDHKEFVDAVSTFNFLASDIKYCNISSTSEPNLFDYVLSILEENVELQNLIYLKSAFQKQGVIGECQTSLVELRTCGVQTITFYKDHFSQSSVVNFPFDKFFDHSIHDSLFETEEVIEESKYSQRRNVSGKFIYDEETQTSFENRSCGIQVTSLDSRERLSISLEETDIISEETSKWIYTRGIRKFGDNVGNIDNDTQTESLFYRTISIQTSSVDLSEPYWQKDLISFQNYISLSSLEDKYLQLAPVEKHFYLHSAQSQTEPIYLKESLIMSEYSRLDESFRTKERLENLISESLPDTVTEITESFEEEIREFQTVETTSRGETYELYSRVTESSQTDPILQDSELLFEHYYNRPFKYVMKTSERRFKLSEVIDTTLPLNVTLKRVSHPRNKTKTTNINLAIGRGWIDLQRSLYCNPSTDEKIPFELAIKSNKIDVIESRCPVNRRFGLYVERNVVKVERLRIKDVLNTETGDLYDEMSARSTGLLLENGSFFDKQSKKELSFEIALLNHYIDVYSDTEVLNYIEKDKVYFKIKFVNDKAKREQFDFYSAIERGLVNLTEATFKDTINKCDLKFEDAVRNEIIQVERINSIQQFHINRKGFDNLIERERLFSSESSTSKSKSTDHFSMT